jgi:hypothetical protein
MEALAQLKSDFSKWKHSRAASGANFDQNLSSGKRAALEHGIVLAKTQGNRALCDRCPKNIATMFRRTRASDPESFQDTATVRWPLSELKLSASTCGFCSFILEMIFYREDYRDNWWQTGADVVVSVTEPGFRLSWGTMHSQFCFEDPPATYSSSLQAGRSIRPMIDIEVIRDWMRYCQPCRSLPVPTQAHRNADHTLRLVNIQERCVVEADDSYKYACLSYVWGKARFHRLTKKNHYIFSTPGGLDRSDLEIPRTFRQAIQLAGRLGFSYIWVDAL